MTPEVLLPLAALALVDSTSIATLVVPLWLLATPDRVRPPRVLFYLAVIAAFYWVVGVALLAGFDAARSLVGGLGGRWVLWVQFVAGAALLVVSFRVQALARRGGPGRIASWRQRAVSEAGGLRVLAVLALTAGVLEIATMFPYLAAVGILTAEQPGVSVAVAVLGGYCLLMVAPALVLLTLRVALGERLQPTLHAIERWVVRNSTEALGWVAGIAGFLLAGDAADRLGLLRSIPW